MSLTWLPLSHRKNVTLPKIVFEEPNNQDYSGYCDYSCGQLIVVYNQDLKEEASVIAHEYRHWLQKELNLLKITVLSPVIFKHESYEDMIHFYFRNSTSEYDALLYQLKYAKANLPYWWLHLVKERKAAWTVM